MVYSTSEHLHSRRETHIGVNKRRDVYSVSSDLCIEQSIVFLELFFGKDAFHVRNRCLYLERLHRYDQFLLVFEMFEKEILDQIARFTVIFRIHGHLSEEILHVRSLDGKCS